VILAAKSILRVIESDQRPTEMIKEDGTLLLSIDLECQRIILDQLAGKLPIMAEEDPSSHSLVTSHKSYYLVDPLDGTSACKRFLRTLGGQVGFGPLGGVVIDGRLEAACYYDVPSRSLYSAVRGQGVYCIADTELDQALPQLFSRPRLQAFQDLRLRDCAALFYTGQRGEMPLVQALRGADAIDTAYRFGGFASDCTRLTRGLEQIQIQFHLKPWDLSASLFPIEAGYAAIFDPLGAKVDYLDWQLAARNPILIAPKQALGEIMQFIQRNRDRIKAHEPE